MQVTGPDAMERVVHRTDLHCRNLHSPSSRDRLQNGGQDQARTSAGISASE